MAVLEKVPENEKRRIEYSSLIVMVYTDEGIIGVGQPSTQHSSNGPIVIDMITSYLKNFIIGEDPFDIEKIWRKMSSYCIFYPNKGILRSAMSGIEIALWDIIGKFLKIPVYKLLGGCYNDKIRVYASGTPWPYNQSIDEHLTIIDELLKKGGFTAYKERANHGLKKDIALVKAFREFFGYDTDLLIDMNRLYDPINAVKFAREIEKYDVFWLEEPIPPDNIEVLKQISKKIKQPVVFGEFIEDRFRIAEIISNHAASIINPDATYNGLMEIKKMSILAESYYIPIAPHNWASSIGFAANLQVAISSLNLLMCEFPLAVDPLDAFIKDPIKINDGFIEPSNNPGLGLELNKEKLENYIYEETDMSKFVEQTKQFVHLMSNNKDFIEFPSYGKR